MSNSITSSKGGHLRSSLALATVGSDVLKATENLKGRVTLNTVVLAEVSLLSAVNLGELDVLLLKGGGSLLVLGGEGLAVATPGSEDYKEAKSAHFILVELSPACQNLHSARTRSFSLTKSLKVSLVSWVTSDSAVATPAMAAKRLRARRFCCIVNIERNCKEEGGYMEDGRKERE